MWFLKKKNKAKKKNLESPSPANIFVKNNKILICDDAAGNRIVLKRYLAYKKCESDETIDGENTIEMVKKNGEYAIIFIDIQMPKMDGITCTRILRQEMGYMGTIIGITGCVDPDSFKKCTEAGMDHVLSKPINKHVLYMYYDKYYSN